MTPKLTTAQRLELIKRALKGEAVAKICRETGISRPLFYRWLKKYEEQGEKGLKPQEGGRPRKSRAPKKPKTLTKLSPSARTKMVEEVLLQGQKAAEVAEKYEVSRVTLYKWIRRYQKAQAKGRRPDLSAKKPKVRRYWRQAPEEYEEAVLALVAKQPEWGIRRLVANLPKVAGEPIVGHHGVQNILRRNSLSTYEQRAAWAEAQVTPITRAIGDILVGASRFFALPLQTRASIIRFVATFALSAFLTVLILGFGGYVARSFAVVPGASRIGFLLASTALLMGSIFFLYSLKYYLTLAIVLSFSQQETSLRANGNGRARGLVSWLLGLANGETNQGGRLEGVKTRPVGLEPNLERVKLKRYPKVSIHIPFYNEKKVVERAIAAVTSFEYPEYEVILADDSTDETTQMIRDYLKEGSSSGKSVKGDGWELKSAEVKPGVTLKHLHRTSRKGFKGGALAAALEHTDPKAEFIVVLDADFVPYPDTLELFLKYFKVQNNMSEDYQKSNVAAVQGYQWHVLNKSENWITRGVRSEYAGSYVIERSGTEIYSGLKQISGAVYMIRRDVLEEVGWETSITEDFQLTLKLYERGYKIVYTPYIQAPAECVSTIKRLVRQRMRWAEGHSHNVRKMFLRLMRSSKLNFTEKLEFLYLSPYYLQATLFLVGTISWLLSETVFPARLPFWTSLWGWSLVLTNVLSLPLMNAVGLFLEESEERDYLGLASFVALSYIIVPFQAYASFKGFLEREEGPWFRTPKTGRITDVFTRGKFYRFISGIIPGRAPATAASVASAGQPAYLPAHLNQYLGLATANNQFNSFSIKPKRVKWVGKVVLSLLLALSVTVYSATRGVPEVLATNWGTLYPHTTTACASTNLMDSTAGSSTTTSFQFVNVNDAIVFYSPQLPTGNDNANTGAGPYDFILEGTYDGAQSGSNMTIEARVSLVDASDCSSNETTDDVAAVAYKAQTTPPQTHSITLTNNANISITSGNPKRIKLELIATGKNKDGAVTMFYDGASGGGRDSRLAVSTLTIPENILFLAPAVFLIPLIISRFLRKKGLVDV